MKKSQSDTFRSTLRLPMPGVDADASAPKTALTDWFERMLDSPFERFSVEDLARSCRQNICPEQIVPIALQVLQNNILAGELYEGELLLSLIHIPDSFWKNHKRLCLSIVSLVASSNRLELEQELGEEDWQTLINFIETLSHLPID